MSSSNSRKRITVVASAEGIETAERALVRLGFESKSNFAESQLVARNAVTKFFQRCPIQLDTFKRICIGLQLDWREILEPDATGVSEIDRIKRAEIIEEGVSVAIEREESMNAIARQVTVINQQQEAEAVIVLRGDITSVDINFKSTLKILLESYAGCTIEVTDIKPGSIRVTIRGEQQGIERLIKQFAVKGLTEVDGFPIESISFKDLLGELEEANFRNKWNIVRGIIRHLKINHKLHNVDLSDADLHGADLYGADLHGADLSGADLSGADLYGADLYDADLSGADLSGASLSGANLSGADLSGADLSGANLSGAELYGTNFCDAKVRTTRFGKGLGISDEERKSLKARGAIFSDALGDREDTYSPARR